MDKRQRIERLAETEEDRILLARIYDRMTAAAQRNVPGSTCFLSRREQVLAQRLLPEAALRFFGGYDGAERAVCCCVPDYLTLEDYLLGENGPVCAVRAAFYEGDRLTHRDFLGALMGSGVKREAVGDILVQTGRCDLLVTREIAPYILSSLESAGRTRLHLSPLPLDQVEPPEAQAKTIRDTVAALRLDSVAAAGFGLSRSKAAAYITGGKAAVNHLPCEKPDRLVAQGDQITVRGLGRLELAEVGGTTKKGRTGVVLRRYV